MAFFSNSRPIYVDKYFMNNYMSVTSFLVSSVHYYTIKIMFYCFKQHIETSGLITELIKVKSLRCVFRKGLYGSSDA